MSGGGWRRTPLPAALLLVAMLAAGAAPAARAQTVAVRDTSLGAFLGRLADSTDARFGLTAAPLDTAGLDTVLSDTALRPRRRLRLGALPSYDFSRVDGNTPGIGLTVRDTWSGRNEAGLGRLRGGYARAAGSRADLWNVEYTNRLWPARLPVDLRLWGGRRTAHLDRDDDESGLELARALLSGTDAAQYLRAEGFEGSLDHTHGAWRVRLGWTDRVESPLVTTTRWNVYDARLLVPENLAAARGRTREADYAVALRWPLLPLATEVQYQTSSRRLGSDFEYRRVRAAAALDLPLGRIAALVPQFTYGRQTGAAVPQAAFYLGGDGTLRSLHRDQRAGSRLAVARLELITAGDLLETLGLPHSGAFPFQGALFGATGAVWGRDPYTGIARDGGWPERRDWSSEIGGALVLRSVLISPETSLRYSVAWPVGPDAGSARWSVSLSRPLDLLRFLPVTE